MSQLLHEKIQAILAQYSLPGLGVTLAEAGVALKLTQEDDRTQVELVCGFPCQAMLGVMQAELQQRLLALDGVTSVKVLVTSKIQAHVVQANLSRHKQVKNIIAIGSGKGGVGKSTVAVNVALALQAAGARVGLLDADIYGPSQPQMLGGDEKPESVEKKYLRPVQRYGVQAVSIGYVIDQDDTPMIWRGPMVSKALQQLLQDTLWDDLDYLIVDLPPGTGDIQLTLAQKVPVSGAVVVTTPQDIAVLDAQRGVRMFEKVKIPILGIVENMSTHICSQCGHEEAIFGVGGGASVAERYHVPLLGQLPLDASIQQNTEAGMPTVVAQPESQLSHDYQAIAMRIAINLSLRERDYSAKFPNVVVK